MRATKRPRTPLQMNAHLKKALKQLPGVRRLIAQRDDLLSERDRLLSDLASLRRSWDEVHRELSATRELLYSTFTGFDFRLADLQRGFTELKQELETELAVSYSSSARSRSRSSSRIRTC